MPALSSGPSFQPIHLISIPDPEQFQDAALQLLKGRDRQTVLTRLPRPKALYHLSQVEKVFTDFDGTIVEPGETLLDVRTQQAVRAAASQHVEIVGVTGKPFAEIEGMVNNHGAEFPLSYLYEKGAFILTHGLKGELQQQYVLATEASVASTAEVKRRFQEFWKPEIEDSLQRTGTPVRLEFAGTGTHQCVLSIDVLDPNLADDGFASVGGGRDSIKIQDPAVIEQVKQLLADRVRKVLGFEKSAPVDLGNANLEWSPANSICWIDKDIGIARYLGLDLASLPGGEIKFNIAPGLPRASMLGDSGNDLPLFALAEATAGFEGHLVFHEKTPPELLQKCSFVSAGRSNGAAHLELISQVLSGRLR